MIFRTALHALSILLAVSAVGTPAPAVASGGSKAADAPTFMRMNPLIVPIIRNGAVDRHLGFVFLLELVDKNSEGKVKELMPRLTNAFVADLTALAGTARAADAGIDSAALKRRLAASCERILGPGIVRDVLIERSFKRNVS